MAANQRNTNTRRDTEIEGRVSALEAGQQAIQEDIRELTQVVTDLAHETRRSLSVIQRPNWQYIMVLISIIIAIGSVYVRDQNKQDTDIDSLLKTRLENARTIGYQQGQMDIMKDQLFDRSGR